MNKLNSVLITGCSSGIGRRAAEMLQKRGYRVFAGARKQEDVQSLQSQGFESILLDLNDSASIHTAFDEVLKRTEGSLGALVNNAGYGQLGAVEDQTRESLRAQFETNVFGLQELTNIVIPIMRKQGYGRIINISSVLGLVSMAHRGAYCASKYAVEALSDALRQELSGSGIFVSLIEPGPITSKFVDSARDIYAKNINMAQSIHHELYQKKLFEVESKNQKKNPFKLPPDAVVKKIIHALESPKPKIRYYVTILTYLLAFIKRGLPARALDRLLIKF
jgi:short-subunit dehydrogenase